MTHVTCRLTAKNRDQLGTLRSAIEHGLPFFTFCPMGSVKQKSPVWLTPHAWPRSIAAVGVTLYTLGFKSACSRPENGDLGGIGPPWPWTATLTFILMWASWGHDSYAYKVLRSEVRWCNNQLETDGHDRLYYRTRLTWQVTICWKWQQGIIVNL